MQSERIIEETIKDQIKEDLAKKGELIETYGHNFWDYLGIQEVGI
jgi:hypothetical protein